MCSRSHYRLKADKREIKDFPQIPTSWDFFYPQDVICVGRHILNEIISNGKEEVFSMQEGLFAER